MIERIADGRTDLIFDWIARGGDARDTDPKGVPLVRWCAYYGDVSAIRHLIAHGEALASLGDNLDLNGAAFHGHWQLCQFLIEAGANPSHALPDTGETPLHAAARAANSPRHERVVGILLAAGADANARTVPGVETGSFMRDCRTKGETPLHRAAGFATARAIHLLIEAGGDVEAKDSAGDTPLSWASMHQRPAAILRLLSHGPHHIHPDADWSGDHGAGWSGMDLHLIGKPHV